MIITISGPSSTGKTSLLESLKDYQDFIERVAKRPVVFGKESIREVVSQRYGQKSLQDIFADPEESIKLQFEVARYNQDLYASLMKNSDVLHIYDRGPLDNLIYTLLCYNSAPEKLLQKYSKDFSKYCALNRALSNCINTIFLTKIDYYMDHPEDDGFRPELFSALRKVEIELFNTIFEKNNRVVNLPSSSSERLSAVLSKICELGSGN